MNRYRVLQIVTILRRNFLLFHVDFSHAWQESSRSRGSLRGFAENTKNPAERERRRENSKATSSGDLHRNRTWMFHISGHANVPLGYFTKCVLHIEQHVFHSTILEKDRLELSHS